MKIVERLTYDIEQLPEAVNSSYSSLALVVSFFAITWAFSQIIFPKLKRLNSIQEELVDLKLPFVEVMRDQLNEYEESLKDAAKEVEHLFMKYETIYRSSMRETISAASLFILTTALVVLVTSVYNFALVILYILFASLMTASILKAYPSPNKLRSVNYIVNSLGYNPYALWGMMRPGFFIDSNNRDYSSGKFTDELHFIIKQNLFVTGWTYYLEAGSKISKKAFYVTSGTVKLSKSTIRSYSEYGVNHYLDVGSLHHSQAKIPNRRGARELKTALLVITPVFRGSEQYPFWLESYNDIKLEAVGYGSSGPELSVNRLREDHSIRYTPKRRGYLIEMPPHEPSHINKELFAHITRMVSKKKHFSITDTTGNMANHSSSFGFKFFSTWIQYMPRFVTDKRLYSKKLKATDNKV